MTVGSSGHVRRAAQGARPRGRRGVAIAALAATFLLSWSASAFAQTNPVLVGSVSDSVNLPGATAVAVSGSYAYTTAYAAGRLTAVTISNPAAPVLAGESASSNALLNASTVNIAGGFAYVASKNRNGPQGSNKNDDGTGNSLTILDISSNPAQPTIVGSVTDATQLFGAYGIAVSGHYAYVAAQGCLSGQPCPKPNVGNAFTVVDVSSPSSPKIVANLHNSGLPGVWKNSNALDHACSVFVSGQYAYVTAAYSNRLTIINIANPLAPTIVASLNDATRLNFPVDVAVSGSYAYVADQGSKNGLTVVNVTNPASPQIVGVLNSKWLAGAYRIRLRGSLAYLSASSGEDVAVVDISNPASPRLAADYYDTGHLWHTTGVDVDATGRYLLATSPFKSTQAQTNYPPFPGQPGGPTYTGTTSVFDLDPTPISVAITPSSEPANPTTLTSANFAFTVSDEVASVRCQLDGAPLGLCTSATTQAYSGLSSGGHTFTVQATDSAGNTASASYAWTVGSGGGGGGGPTNSQPPSISGSPVEAQMLTANPGTWSGAPSFTYQWQDCRGTACTPITGATGPTYTLLSADVGSSVNVVVTAAITGASTQATSASTAVVTSAPGPLTPVLDNFNRADNTGPPGPSWSAFPDFDTSSSNTLFVSGQELTGDAGENADYWNAQTFGPNSEVYVTVLAKPTVNNDIVVLGLRYQSPGTAGRSSGYQARFINEASGTDQYQILLRTNGASTSSTLASVTGPELVAGDSLLFRAIGTTLELWRNSAGTWTKILSATNGTIATGGYLALIARDNAVRLDNFGGGTLP